MKTCRPLAALALAALLAACGRDAPAEGEVTGEVFEGTISDDMLDLEQVRSLPPLADPTGTPARGAGTGEAEEPADEEAPDGESPVPDADD